MHRARSRGNPSTIHPAMKTRNGLAFTVLTLIALNTGAGEESIDQILALDPDLINGERVYQLCAACHGNDGYGGLAGEFPSIAGQHPRVLLKQLIDIQSKKRINPTMFPFSDAETLGGFQGMADVIAYVASLPINPQPTTGPIELAARGGELYQAHCAVCHGEGGAGDDDLSYPLLTGQHYVYLVREITWIRDDIRKNSDPAMVQLLKPFSDKEIAAVASYISHLEP